MSNKCWKVVKHRPETKEFKILGEYRSRGEAENHAHLASQSTTGIAIVWSKD